MHENEAPTKLPSSCWSSVVVSPPWFFQKMLLRTVSPGAFACTPPAPWGDWLRTKVQLVTVLNGPEQKMPPPDAAPADYHDRVWMDPDGSPIGFAADPVWFESLAVELDFDGRDATAVRLHPVELGMDLPRQQRGVPRLVDAARGRQILARLASLSDPFGTELAIAVDGGRATATVDVARAGRAAT